MSSTHTDPGAFINALKVAAHSLEREVVDLCVEQDDDQTRGRLETAVATMKEALENLPDAGEWSKMLKTSSDLVAKAQQITNEIKTATAKPKPVLSVKPFHGLC
jgi:hypothetical protein